MMNWFSPEGSLYAEQTHVISMVDNLTVKLHIVQYIVDVTEVLLGGRSTDGQIIPMSYQQTYQLINIHQSFIQ